MKTCPKCKGISIDEGVVVSYGAVRYKSNSKSLFGSPAIKASVCIDCGYMEYHIDKDKLKKYLK